MVSNVLRIDQDELIAKLEELARTSTSSDEYHQLRGQLPADWPC